MTAEFIGHRGSGEVRWGCCHDHLSQQRDKPQGEGVYRMANIGLSAFSRFFMRSAPFLSRPRSPEEGGKNLERPDAGRHGEDTERRSHPLDARSGMKAFQRLDERGSHRTRRDRVLLLARRRLPAASEARARQWRERALSFDAARFLQAVRCLSAAKTLSTGFVAFKWLKSIAGKSKDVSAVASLRPRSRLIAVRPGR